MPVGGLGCPEGMALGLSYGLSLSPLQLILVDAPDFLGLDAQVVQCLPLA